MSPPPLPPADPNEHQYWTDPILCEETRARLEHFRSIGWLPPNFKPKTLEGLAVVERYWRRYVRAFSDCCRDRTSLTYRRQILHPFKGGLRGVFTPGGPNNLHEFLRLDVQDLTTEASSVVR